MEDPDVFCVSCVGAIWWINSLAWLALHGEQLWWTSFVQYMKYCVNACCRHWANITEQPCTIQFPFNIQCHIVCGIDAVTRFGLCFAFIKIICVIILTHCMGLLSYNTIFCPFWLLCIKVKVCILASFDNAFVLLALQVRIYRSDWLIAVGLLKGYPQTIAAHIWWTTPQNGLAEWPPCSMASLGSPNWINN